MPNPCAIYLHDTPSKRLFGAATCAFSHGCARVADPLCLAARLFDGTRSEVDNFFRNRAWDEVKGPNPKPVYSTSPEPIEPPPIKTSTVMLRTEFPV